LWLVIRSIRTRRARAKIEKTEEVKE